MSNGETQFKDAMETLAQVILDTTTPDDGLEAIDHAIATLEYERSVALDLTDKDISTTLITKLKTMLAHKRIQLNILRSARELILEYLKDDQQH